MKKKIVFLVSFIFIIAACEKLSQDYIKGNVSDKFTGEALADVPLVLVSGGYPDDIANLSVSDFERMKYYAVTNANGSYLVKNIGLDIGRSFYVDFVRPYDFDSTVTAWKYKIRGSSADSLWVQKGIHTELKLRPLGIVRFKHPIVQNESYAIDTIQVEVYNQVCQVTKNHQTSDEFFVLPSHNHTIKLTYINDGQKTEKYISRYISTAYTLDSNKQSLKLIRYEIHIPDL